MLADNVDRHPALFRTYRAPANQSFNCQIWEAARATTATPMLFDPISIGFPGIALKYIDAGISLNNPVQQIRSEASTIFPDRPVACIISIGSGIPTVIHIQENGLSQLASICAPNILKTALEMATDCEEKHNETSRDFSFLPNIYFRFNVDQGLQNVGVEEWKRISEVEAHTKQYMLIHETSQRLDLAVQKINPTSEDAKNLTPLHPVKMKT